MYQIAKKHAHNFLFLEREERERELHVHIHVEEGERERSKINFYIFQATAPSVLLIIFTFGVTFSFALGPGAIPWLMVSELFQQEARPFAVSIATIVNWLSNFSISLAFPFMLVSYIKSLSIFILLLCLPLLKDYLKPYPFIIFMCISAVIWIFMYCYLVETKGKSIEEIMTDIKTITSSTTKRFIRFQLRRRDPPLGVNEQSPIM